MLDYFIFLINTNNALLCSNIGVQKGYSITFIDKSKCYGVATFNDLDQCRIPPKFLIKKKGEK
jgi:hypothetical protein